MLNEKELYILCPNCLTLELLNDHNWRVQNIPIYYQMDYDKSEKKLIMSEIETNPFSTHYGKMIHLECGADFKVDSPLDLMLLIQDNVLYLGNYWWNNKDIFTSCVCYDLDGKEYKLKFNETKRLEDLISTEWL